MPSSIEPTGALPSGPVPARPGLRLGALLAAALLLVAAGAVLWWLRGEAVFSDTVLAALSWCF